MPRGAIGDTYDDAARAADDDSDQGRGAMARWALVVPWYREHYPGMVSHDLTTVGATPDSNKRAW